uniref:SMP domain-containing protein n=1 Tax=Opuntia streptacantha TaxID=393608 RepID=A0A7C8Z3Q8_OPUST
MAQEQPRRGGPEKEPIKYGDVFNVSGEVANQPVLSEDAAAMLSAEKIVFGLSPLGGPASVMQSAASVNVQAGLVDPCVPKVTDQIRVTESKVHGTRFVTEAIGDEVIYFIVPCLLESA